ncbi:hypothetical protein F3Y22_tig00112383pilonHSYRG00274 [Hibiscus syriacus]|uniref:Uncharacterized protein n=1 Tax=Hibiscus syriacus TaxID=106335 RepID=A0A6A2X0C9_HIBSY|nr:hypothetical protein F3Y22_tig00112383pilonHSYRG00274 [Hibiscus syriacus]
MTATTITIAKATTNEKGHDKGNIGDSNSGGKGDDKYRVRDFKVDFRDL